MSIGSPWCSHDVTGRHADGFLMGRMPERDLSEYSRDPAEFRPARESSPWRVAIVLLVLAVAAAGRGGLFSPGGGGFWPQRRAAPPAAPVSMTPQPDSPPVPAAPPAAPVATGPQNPIDAL